MPEDRAPEASDLYTERLIRSVAHNIGNLVNVMSGRLSLLELQEGIGPDALQVIGLMRERLRRTQGELRQAVRFVSETTKPVPRPDGGSTRVMSYLEGALPAISGEIRGWTDLQGNVRAESCVSSYPLTLPLIALHGGLEKLSRGLDAPSWWLALMPEGLALGIDASDAVFPADRRSLLEPWFDSKLVRGAQSSRRDGWKWRWPSVGSRTVAHKFPLPQSSRKVAVSHRCARCGSRCQCD
jgi:hypothetical protein